MIPSYDSGGGGGGGGLKFTMLKFPLTLQTEVSSSSQYSKMSAKNETNAKYYTIDKCISSKSDMYDNHK